MKDLKIKFNNAEGKQVEQSYDTIMDFTDSFETAKIDGNNVEVDFFENPLLHKNFDTLNALYKHCVQIMR